MTNTRPGAVEGITVSEHGSVTVTGAGIPYFRLLALQGALKLEALGMKRRGRSALTIAKKEYGLKGNRERVQAQLAALIAEYVQAHPVEEGK